MQAVSRDYWGNYLLDILDFLLQRHDATTRVVHDAFQY